MDDLDRELWRAWNEWNPRNPRKMKTAGYATALLRSWALVLRAGDSRLEGMNAKFEERNSKLESIANNQARMTNESEARVTSGETSLAHPLPTSPGGGAVSEVVELWGEDVRELCRARRIGEPGVSIAEAGRQFGVGINTIRRWERRGIVKVRRYTRGPKDIFIWPGWKVQIIRSIDPTWPRKKKFPCLNHALVSTRGWVEPGGEVWSGPWGEMRRNMVKQVGDDVVVRLERAKRRMGAQGSQWQWRCKWCGRWVFKLYWPTATKTVMQAQGVAWWPAGWKTGSGGFMCRRCAGLVYESAERTSRSSTGWRVDVMERFMRRISGGAWGR